MPYNIALKYHMEDIESNHDYTLAPADYDKSVKLAHIVKYAWLETYDEVAGIDFTRQYVPKVLHLVGSAAYEDNGTMVLGTAEGGLKVTLYLVNNLKIDADFLNEYYFKTMHHEFAHILHQTKSYDQMETAGTKGAEIINQKLTIVKNYMQTAWNIDMDELRDVVQRRMSDVVTGEIDLETLK